MTETHVPQPPPFDTEYAVPSGLGWKAAGALATGGLLTVAILIRFATLIAAPTNRPAHDGGMESGWVGGMGAAAFIFLGYGLSLLRRPVRARLTAREILIEGFVSRKAVPWETNFGATRRPRPWGTRPSTCSSCSTSRARRWPA